MPDENGVYCINCGSEVSTDTTLCPECGSNQDPEQYTSGRSNESVEHDGFTSWAIGFKPTETGRNIIVGILYVLFSGIGVPLLIIGYLLDNPGKMRYLQYIWAGLLMLFALASFSVGTPVAFAVGAIVIGVGAMFIPQVRDRINLNDPPGIGETNSARRNFLTGTGYAFGGFIISTAAVGSVVPNTSESQTSSATQSSQDNQDTGDSSGSSAGGSDDSSTEDSDDTSAEDSDAETYPDAFYYDDSTGIVFEEGITAEADSIGSLYIRGTARNESGQDYSYIQVTWAILDSSDAKIADALANVSGLDNGRRWRYEAVAASADGADSYELEDVTAY